MTMVVGVDVHVTTAPPSNPVHHYTGMVMDFADYIPLLGTNVSINGLKRGVSDIIGIIIPMVPLCRAFRENFCKSPKDCHLIIPIENKFRKYERKIHMDTII